MREEPVSLKGPV